jgi:hypothetical protein
MIFHRAVYCKYFQGFIAFCLSASTAALLTCPNLASRKQYIFRGQVKILHTYRCLEADLTYAKSGILRHDLAQIIFKNMFTHRSKLEDKYFLLG